jgi:tRNA nucleotidyltransferase (CCA-adding enzyme)
MAPERIVRRICDAGHQVFIVGGSVRDLFLGIDPEDVDLATSASNDILKEIFKDENHHLVGRRCQSMIIHGIDIVPFRTDTYFGGGKNDVEVELVGTIQEDLKRRDFTVNAMALCPFTGEIIDPYGGQEDIKKRIVRFIDRPIDHIKSDPSRMFRAASTASIIGGRIHRDTLEAIKFYGRGHVDMVPWELRRKILFRALRTPNPSIFFRYLKKMNLLEHILPSLNATYNFEGGSYHDETVFQHCLLVGDHLHPKYPLLRLAGYLHDVGKPSTFKEDHFIGHEDEGAKLAAIDMEALKFSPADISYVKGIIKTHMRHVHYPTAKARRKLMTALAYHGITFEDWLRMRVADRIGNLKKPNQPFSELIAVYRKYRELDKTPLNVNQIALNGKSIMELLGITPGPEVGKFKKALFDYIIEHGEEYNTEEHLITVLKDLRDNLNG